MSTSYFIGLGWACGFLRFTSGFPVGVLLSFKVDGPDTSSCEVYFDSDPWSITVSDVVLPSLFRIKQA